VNARHYGVHTQEAYVMLIRRYIHVSWQEASFGNWGAGEANRFLTHMAVNRTVSTSTENQVLTGTTRLPLTHRRGRTAV